MWSNAVIEHIGSREAQEQVAREVMRVGRNWFVTTPTRWFPLELHMRRPLVTWLPREGMSVLGRMVSYSSVRRQYGRGHNWTGLRLLSARGMKALFLGSRIIRQGVTVWPEVLMAVGGECIHP